MATTKPKKITGRPRTMNPSPTEETLNKKISTIQSTIGKLDRQSQLKVLLELGVGDKIFTCHRCGLPKFRDAFYASSEVGNESGVCKICKSCTNKLVMVDDGKGNFAPTKQSVIDTLRELNKPFLNTVWDAALLEAANTTGARRYANVWNAYISQINLPAYQTLTFFDSDMYTGGKYSIEDMSTDALPKDQEIIDSFEKNKADVKRLLGYEPFEKEKLADQPFLYSQLVGFLDASEDANEDMMRISSAIEIVRGFLQQAQINDKIAIIMQDPDAMERKVPVIKQLYDMKSKVSSVISELAEQSCISQKHNKNAKKGENTWTGRIRKLKDMNLREQEVNAFDIGTCEGMRQVADISNASILKQIRLDENDYTEMLGVQREKLVELQRQVDEWQEKARILLRENLDLKAYISEQGISVDGMLSSDTILTGNSDLNMREDPLDE